jgi:hypothetical protein
MGNKKLVFGKYKKILRIKINHERAGFFAYFIFVLNQLRYCEKHNLFPVVYFGERSGIGFNKYFDPGHGDNMWDYYFDPVAGYTYKDICEMVDNPANPLKEEDIIELGGGDLWYLHKEDPESIYGYTYGVYKSKEEFDGAGYNKQRRKASYFVDKYIKVKSHITEKVKEFYEKNMAGHNVLGIHLRGTDKGSAKASSNVMRVIGPEAYVKEIDKYSEKNPGCKIFVATDQEQYLEFMENKYGDRVISYDAIRSHNQKNPFQVDDGKNYKKGEDALIDCLLLSKCNFFLKCTSHLGETALYFNPKLKCLDLNYLY